MSGDESVYSVGADEFEQPTVMKQFYCEKITPEEYEMETESETEKAIQDLLAYLEKKPEEYICLLKKRKQEELENSGIISLLKVRLLQKMQGAKYRSNEVSEEECQVRLDDLKTGMLMAHNYAQETKGRRFSRRLAVKRARKAKSEDQPTPIKQTRFAKQAVPPTPPPCPPPKRTPLKDLNVMHSTPFQANLKRKPLERHVSSASLQSVHHELLSTNPLERLKSVNRTPGTPGMRNSNRTFGSTDTLNYTNPLNHTEPLSKAFYRVMEQKFRNVRSPSPIGNSSGMSPSLLESPAGFTP